MSKRLTTEEFIEKSRIIHGDKYDYSLVEYKNNRTKVKIICPEHGEFEQRPCLHLQGNRCSKCAGKYTNNEDFIENARKIHGDKYDYNMVEYINTQIKVKIICPEHGVFEQNPSKHITSKQGCPKCAGKYMNNDEFIKRARKVHGDKYNYSLVNYINAHHKVKIICPEHGIFEQTPNKHLNAKQICQLCSMVEKKKKLSSNTNEFIEKAKKIHGNEYVNTHTKVKIICKKHGIFEQIPMNHIGLHNENGCPICKESRGEKEINYILKKNKIIFETQKTFEGCVFNKKLRFDFYLPEKNICIEYDGRQHYEVVNIFGGENGFALTQERDVIKNQYCKDNNIPLYRIRYDENTLETLNNILKKEGII